MENEVRVLVISGNARERDALSAVINRAPGITLVGTADNAESVIRLIEYLKPGALLMDIDTSGSDPVDDVSRIMRNAPVPIVLMSSKERDAGIIFEAISSGALTVVKKPVLTGSDDDDTLAAKVLRDIKTYSRVSVIRHVRGSASASEARRVAAKKQLAPAGHIAVIASSTGGPQALKTVLSKLPASFPAGIVIAQHISQGFTQGLVEWLNGLCAIQFKEAVDGEKIIPGTAYLAPDGFHITVNRFGQIGLDNRPPIGGHRPSCNELLKSAADTYGEKSIGVILSGMGEDGAKGLKAIRDAGGKTYAQDEESCAVFGMPKIALEIGAVARTTPLECITDELIRDTR